MQKQGLMCFCDLFQIKHQNILFLYILCTVRQDVGIGFSERNLDRAKFQFYFVTGLCHKEIT